MSGLVALRWRHWVMSPQARPLAAAGHANVEATEREQEHRTAVEGPQVLPKRACPTTARLPILSLSKDEMARRKTGRGDDEARQHPRQASARTIGIARASG